MCYSYCWRVRNIYIYLCICWCCTPISGMAASVSRRCYLSLYCADKTIANLLAQLMSTFWSNRFAALVFLVSGSGSGDSKWTTIETDSKMVESVEEAASVVRLPNLYISLLEQRKPHLAHRYFQVNSMIVDWRKTFVTKCSGMKNKRLCTCDLIW